jgi:hypothetical protein
MEPVGRTESIDRGWIVNHLEVVEREGGQELKVEIAQAPNFFRGDEISTGHGVRTRVWSGEMISYRMPRQVMRRPKIEAKKLSRYKNGTSKGTRI